MRRFSIFLLLIFIAIFTLPSCGYNNMVAMDEEVSAAWGNVENQYQRRADLIPNLVNTVKGYAAHESETLEAVIAARAKATSVNVDYSNLDQQTLQEYQQNQSQLSSALGKLMVVSERYPELKANQNFSDLQAQIEGTENRIAVERRKFNEVVKGYNTLIRKFPQNIIASMFSFSSKPYFEAESGTEKAPEVKF